MTDTDMSASEPELHGKNDSVVQLKTKLYDKKRQHAFGVYISQLTRHFGGCPWKEGCC